MMLFCIKLNFLNLKDYFSWNLLCYSFQKVDHSYGIAWSLSLTNNGMSTITFNPKSRFDLCAFGLARATCLQYCFNMNKVLTKIVVNSVHIRYNLLLWE